MKIGIRRETKNKWERRVPLVPADLAYLKKEYGIESVVQTSPIRAFSDQEYLNYGIEINENLDSCNTIFAIKEIPINVIEPAKTYVFFSHTIKGQPHNMPLLKRFLEVKANLIDYERIVDDNNRRLIFFGHYAGLAGMVETFHAIGIKLRKLGYHNPFEKIKQPYMYEGIDDTIENLMKVAEDFKKFELPEDFYPFVIGFAGYGNVSKGAQQILEIFPHITLTPDELLKINELDMDFHGKIVKVVFHEEHTVKRKEGKFNLSEYYTNPQNYISDFDKYIPFLDVLVNCILWTNDNPRLITKEYLRKTKNLKLKVIGDISCDINGGVEICYKATTPDEPSFTYFPDKDEYSDGIFSDGVSVMAIDNLPCEFPRDSSISFSSVLKDFVPAIFNEDFNNSYESLNLPEPIKRALIVHNGELTQNYQYLKKFVG